MGYYTNYEVAAKSDSAAAEKAAIDALIEVFGYSADREGHNCFRLYDSKWYDWEKDVGKVSADHPGVIFELSGEGEESGDIWRAWAHAGDVHKAQAQMTFEEPEWLPEARSKASQLVSELSAAEAAELERKERAELARLQEKYKDA